MRLICIGHVIKICQRACESFINYSTLHEKTNYTQKQETQFKNKKPTKQKEKPDIGAAEKKADALNNEIETIQNLFAKKKYRLVFGLAEKLKGKIRTMRASGLSSGGIYSAENLAFKILRNNGLENVNGSIDLFMRSRYGNKSVIVLKRTFCSFF